MSRVVWLLDVDGVLNATRPGWGAAPRSGTAYGDGHPYRLRWSSALITRIRALHDTGTVTVRWCSTWCADADQIERLFALPRLERAWTDPISHSAAPAAKLAAARAVLDQGHRLIWTDDDAVPTSGPVHDELLATGRALLIAPLPNRGLQPEHLDAIEAFVSASPGPGTAGTGPHAAEIARRLLGDTT
ncbi:hypothetical protein [Actinoplanes flavus]|uniref:Secreted protein n=1 Tax=Actinoplanes flavus TaxID=2820290 RepID=A0ABS3USE1_9ACTN|nr:hypothetical protein [Actinoplanes flavus]MBO3741503.1 hypothetical protein [Actinoplanes flavus]